jgi:preprotein translocase subunit SecE
LIYGHRTTVSIKVSKTFDLGSNPSARASGYGIWGARSFNTGHNLRKSQTINQMNKIGTYFRESYKELLEKVSWPSWSELQQSTVIVLVATLIITLVVGIMDIISSSLLKLIYSFFS